MSSHHIELLPSVCLVKVFSYLRWHDLFNVTLTSSTFNDVVSSSAKVLERVTFNWKPWNSTCTRSYTKIRFDCDDADFRTFILLHEERVKNCRELLLRSGWNIKIASMADFLRRAKNLKRVSLTSSIEIKAKGQPEIFNDLELPTLKLESLKVDYEYENLQFFTNSIIKSLSIKSGSKSENLENFLKTQEELETLELESFEDYSILISDEFKFRLKTLILRDCEATPSLIGLLMRYEKTLRNVTLRGTISTNLINSMRGLRNLNLKIIFEYVHKSTPYTILDPLQTLTNVTSLEISLESTSIKIPYSNFHQKFPNARNLRLRGFTGLIRPMTPFENVENLTLDFVLMKYPLIIPKVKKLHFRRVTFQMIRMPFDFKENVLEELNVDDCNFCAWFNNFMECPEMSLKVANLYKSSTNVKQEIVDKHSHKIKRLRIC